MSQHSIIEQRREQAFPKLAPAEVERLRCFGQGHRFKEGELVARAGEPTEGLMLMLSGHVRMAPRDKPDQTIVTHGPGEFQSELAQLSGRPSLVDGTAEEHVDVVLIRTPRVRDLMVEEAELGERIMRALILRRVGLLQQQVGGPIIVGRAGDRNVLRLENFLERNGHPHRREDPHGAEDGDLPIILCPNGKVLHNPTENQLARCLGLARAINNATIYDVAVVGAGPAGLATAVYGASEGLSVIVVDCRAFGGQAGASARIENYLGFPTGIRGMALMARAYNQAQKFGAEMAIPEEAIRLDCEEPLLLRLKTGDSVRAKSVVLASGAEYRRLNVASLRVRRFACALLGVAAGRPAVRG